MSSGNPIPLSYAKQYVSHYLADVSKVCIPGRAVVVGSVRRQKSEVHDIELLVIPYRDQVAADMFGGDGQMVSRLDSYLREQVSVWGAELLTDGPMTKNIMLKEGIKLQIFVSDTARWGVEMVIKTGPSDFSKKCVTRRDEGGYLPSWCRIADGWKVKNAADEVLHMPTEFSFLEFLGLGWVEPQDRHPGLKWR